VKRHEQSISETESLLADINQAIAEATTRYGEAQAKASPLSMLADRAGRVLSTLGIKEI
jgi:hypothetical protein